MQYKTYCAVSGVLFALVALAHLARVILDMAVVVEGDAIPMWVSWCGVVVPAALAFWGFAIVRSAPPL